MSERRFVCLLVLGVAVLCGGNKQEVKMDAEGKSGTISFGPPDLSDEESESLHMPAQLKCDGCRIIAHMLSEAFHKAETKRPSSSKSLPESDILEVTDEICYSDFKQYGITEIDGKKRLKGPGLINEGAFGITQSGGKWPVRLHEMCTEYMGELDEEEIYGAYRQGRETADPHLFSAFLCVHSGRLAHCAEQKQPSQEL